MNDLSGYTDAYYCRDIHEYWFEQHGLLRPDQLAALCYTFNRPFWGMPASPPRDPGHVVSIGCGAGFLEATLERLGVTVTGVDPSPGARHLYQGSTLVDRYGGGGDTLIFCESIEHLPADETDRIISLAPTGARIIIVNWPDFHPIHPDGSGWDHVALIDDHRFDQLTAGHTIVERHGSHLVFDKDGPS